MCESDHGSVSSSLTRSPRAGAHLGIGWLKELVNWQPGHNKQQQTAPQESQSKDASSNGGKNTQVGPIQAQGQRGNALCGASGRWAMRGFSRAIDQRDLTIRKCGQGVTS
jgi:hypothetical protein